MIWVPACSPYVELILCKKKVRGRPHRDFSLAKDHVGKHDKITVIHLQSAFQGVSSLKSLVNPPQKLMYRRNRAYILGARIFCDMFDRFSFVSFGTLPGS